MNEEEWLACDDAKQLLTFLRAEGRASDRKVRLLMAAACRRGLHLLDEPQYQALIEAVERVADGSLSPASLARYRTNCPPVSLPDFLAEERRWQEHPRDFSGPLHAKRAVWLAGSRDRHKAEDCLLYAARGLKARQVISEEQAKQCRLVRDLFGPLPFRPVRIDPAWLSWNDGTIKRLAEAIYDQRSLPEGHLDGQRLAVLADALEDAGCGNADILDHLRGPGVHVRGCHIIDLLTGRE